MEEKKYLKTESFSNTNRIPDLNSNTTCFKKNIKKSKTRYDNLNLINQKIIFNMMKNSKGKNYRQRNKTKCNLNYFPKSKNRFSKDFKYITNLNQNYLDLPGISNFHNITGEKINSLIKSNDKDETSSFIYYNTNNNYKMKSERKTNDRHSADNSKKKTILSKKNNNIFFNRISTAIKDITQNNRYKKYKLEPNIFKMKIREINSNLTKDLDHFKTQIVSLKDLVTPIKKEKLKNKDKNLLNKIKLTNLSNKRANKSATKRWVESLRSSIRTYDFIAKGKSLPRKRKNNEENDMEEKQEDQYILLKNKISIHESKFEKYIRKIKLNQVNKEHLMKKFIFDTVTSKKFK